MPPVAGKPDISQRASHRAVMDVQPGAGTRRLLKTKQFGIKCLPFVSGVENRMPITIQLSVL